MNWQIGWQKEKLDCNCPVQLKTLAVLGGINIKLIVEFTSDIM